MDESQKNMILVPVSVACLTTMALQFFTNFGDNFSYGMLGVNILIGAAVGGAAFGAMFFMNKR